MDSVIQSYLLVGLGNPGREYRHNRHNIGFMVLDRLAEEYKIRPSRVQSLAIVGIGKLDDARVLLAKPQTYMNLSGRSVASLMRFYKLSLEQLLIIHDDIDLPFGVLRLRPDGGPGGQKGLASTIQELGTQQFPRLRVGIGRPPGQMDPAAYVLQDFHKDEQELLEIVLNRAVDAIKLFVDQGLNQAMTQFNGPVEKG
jgi:PTH1 family peptidyl-tRNA hydrolase